MPGAKTRDCKLQGPEGGLQNPNSISKSPTLKLQHSESSGHDTLALPLSTWALAERF